MTVTRSKIQEFAGSLRCIADSVRRALSKSQGSYRYVQVVENEDGTSFEAKVWPNFPLMLSTQLFIEIHEREQDICSVTIRTKSQWFIWGDIFDYYNKYVREFLEVLEKEIENS